MNCETANRLRAQLVREMLRTHGSVRLRVFGSSMLPTIWPGDVINIEACESSQLQVNDVVFYFRRHIAVVHRIRSRFENSFVTQGDALSRPDDQIASGLVLGRVVAIERQGALLSVRGPGRLTLKLFRLSGMLGRAVSRLYAEWRSSKTPIIHRIRDRRRFTLLEAKCR
jgi:hypothetical protein